LDRSQKICVGVNVVGSREYRNKRRIPRGKNDGQKTWEKKSFGWDRTRKHWVQNFFFKTRRGDMGGGRKRKKALSEENFRNVKKVASKKRGGSGKAIGPPVRGKKLK